MSKVGSADDAVRDTTGAAVVAAAGDGATKPVTAAVAAAAVAAALPAVDMGAVDGGGQWCRIDCACWDGCCSGRGCCCYGSVPAVRGDCLYAGSETCLGSWFCRIRGELCSVLMLWGSDRPGGGAIFDCGGRGEGWWESG